MNETKPIDILNKIPGWIHDSHTPIKSNICSQTRSKLLLESIGFKRMNKKQEYHFLHHISQNVLIKVKH